MQALEKYGIGVHTLARAVILTKLPQPRHRETPRASLLSERNPGDGP